MSSTLGLRTGGAKKADVRLNQYAMYSLADVIVAWCGRRSVAAHIDDRVKKEDSNSSSGSSIKEAIRESLEV